MPNFVIYYMPTLPVSGDPMNRYTR